MKQTKKLSLLIVMIIMIFVMSISSYAESEGFELQLNTSSDTFNIGDTFLVEIVLDNINVTSGDQGIGAYVGTITYDTNVLELVEITAATGWEVMENEGNIIVNTTNAEVVKNRTVTASINFKVKENAQIGQTTISLENVEGSSGLTTIVGTAISSQINIVEASSENPDNPQDPGSGDNNQNNTGNNSGNNNQNNNSNNSGGTNRTNTIQNSTVGTANTNSATNANQKIPFAGLGRNIVIGMIVIFGISAVIFYIKYKKAV